MMATREDQVSLSRLSALQWGVLAGALILGGIGIWQSILPYLAERHYRDGFNFDAATRYKYAVEELELAAHGKPSILWHLARRMKAWRKRKRMSLPN
ncbi:hypothetical protein EBR57_01755 [bacterium]|nr:hypothetical protein [bacterium]